MADKSIEVVLDDTTRERLEACAKWRNVSVERLVRAYVEDWVDVDYPESKGRHTRRNINRDGPIGLDENFLASRNWIEELKSQE